MTNLFFYERNGNEQMETIAKLSCAALGPCIALWII